MYKIHIFDIASKSSTEFICEEYDEPDCCDVHGVMFIINDNAVKIFIPPTTLVTIEEITDETFS